METVPFEKLNCLFPIASYNRIGLQVALSSDSPMMPSNPLIGIYTAVTRRELHGKVLAQEEGISPMDAVRMYTLGGAYASFEEGIKGSITPGKLADLIILSSNPNQVEPEELKDIKVMMTIINGKVVWER
jgi:predicted amidohydrolase YtcJ